MRSSPPRRILDARTVFQPSSWKYIHGHAPSCRYDARCKTSGRYGLIERPRVAPRFCCNPNMSMWNVRMSRHHESWSFIWQRLTQGVTESPERSLVGWMIVADGRNSASGAWRRALLRGGGGRGGGHTSDHDIALSTSRSCPSLKGRPSSVTSYSHVAT